MNERTAPLPARTDDWRDGHTALLPAAGRRRRYYVIDKENDARIWLRSQNLDDALTETRDLEAAAVGQIVDVHETGVDGAVATSVDVTG